jgi:steroid delta-isomerase-like uncharacterized protein
MRRKVTEQNTALVQYAWEELLNKQNLTVLNETSTSDYTYHDTGTTLAGIDVMKQSLQPFFTAFPDGQYTIQDIGAWDDKVVVRYIVTGTQTGPLSVMGNTIPATGNKIQTTAISIFRCQEGKIAEVWNNHDDLSLLEQLGVIPTSG